MQLRDYQQQLLNNINKAFAAGHRDILVPLATGGGKTVVASHFISSLNVPTMIIVHRQEILEQWSIKLSEYNIYHNIIASKATLHNIIRLHAFNFNKVYIYKNAKIAVVMVDTLIKKNIPQSHLDHIQLIVHDEAHHVLQNNKWGKVRKLFNYARGLHLTATPKRADGWGLGRHASGFVDFIIPCISMQELISRGYLARYKIHDDTLCKIDISKIPLSKDGDYSQAPLRKIVHDSKIVGNIVAHYLKYAQGKLGLTFTVDIAHAEEIADEFIKNGVKAAVITGKTNSYARAELLQKFKKREILQIVSVDLFDEGVDIADVECVSFARPTKSLVKYMQQFGRVLRPSKNKKFALIFDHVGNVKHHKLPDITRIWSLDNYDKNYRSSNDTKILISTCRQCFKVYEKYYKTCPFCNFKNPVTERSRPENVCGDLTEIDSSVIEHLRKEIIRIDSSPRIPKNVNSIVERSIIKKHNKRLENQKILRNSIAYYAGIYKAQGFTDSMIYRKFYLDFDIDILTAQTLGATDAEKLTEKINSKKE